MLYHNEWVELLRRIDDATTLEDLKAILREMVTREYTNTPEEN